MYNLGTDAASYVAAAGAACHAASCATRSRSAALKNRREIEQLMREKASVISPPANLRLGGTVNIGAAPQPEAHGEPAGLAGFSVSSAASIA